jgi:hypothetical protein
MEAADNICAHAAKADHSEIRSCHHYAYPL